MLTHVHTSSTLCGYQVGSKDETVEEIEKEKAMLATDWTWGLTLGSVGSFITAACCLAEKSKDDRTLGI
jgi:hypothetical protein